MGPAISQRCFGVGDEVKAVFEKNSGITDAAFIPSERNNHWYADLYLLAKSQLGSLGVEAVYGAQYCTYSDSLHVYDSVSLDQERLAIDSNRAEFKRFFSYRRDGETGRMASLIWLKKGL